MPPETPDNAGTRLNGMQFRRNVGGDAHIDPPTYVYPRTPMNGTHTVGAATSRPPRTVLTFPVEWGNVILPRPIQHTGWLRVDVGIDPYIETIRACHSTFSPIP